MHLTSEPNVIQLMKIVSISAAAAFAAAAETSSKEFGVENGVSQCEAEENVISCHIYLQI